MLYPLWPRRQFRETPKLAWAALDSGGTLDTFRVCSPYVTVVVPQKSPEPVNDQVSTGAVDAEKVFREMLGRVIVAPAYEREFDEFKKQVIAAFKHLGLNTRQFFGE